MSLGLCPGSRSASGSSGMELPAPGHRTFITTGTSSLCPFRNGSNEEVIARGRQRSEREGGGRGRLREGREKPGQCSLLEPVPMSLERKLSSTEQKKKKPPRALTCPCLPEQGTVPRLPVAGPACTWSPEQ